MSTTRKRKPAPRGPKRPAPQAPAKPTANRTLWIVNGVLLVAVVVIAGVLVARSQSGAPAPPPAKHPAAADANAPAALVAAANAIGFHTSTEPGVGLTENDPASSGSATSDPSLLKPGTAAPGFTLKTPQGQSVSLSDYKGKAVLLELFATWCPHCQAEAPHLARLYAQLAPKGVQFLSVNGDSENAASVFAFHRYFALPYPALLDYSGSPSGSFTRLGHPGPVSSAYRLQSFPTFYVIKPDGTIAWAGQGEQPDAFLKQQLLKVAPQA
jgi:peroxiredoxin